MFTCNICQSTIQNKNKFTTNCNHEFCNSCITHWLLLKDNCPMCRHNIIQQNKKEEVSDEEDSPKNSPHNEESLFTDSSGNKDDSIEKRAYDVPGGYGIRYENEDVGNKPHPYKQYKNGGTFAGNRLSYDGYWQAYDSRVDTKGINQYYVYFRPNIAGNWGQEVNKRGVLSENRQWKWEPSNDKIIDYEKLIYQ